MSQRNPRTSPKVFSHALSLPLVQFPVRLSFKNEVHLTRKLFHIGIGLLMAGLYSTSMSQTLAMKILGAVLTLFILGEAIRLRVPRVNQLAMKFFGPVMRNNEIHRASGIPYYIAGAFVSVMLFPKVIAILSILHLAIGDPLASYFGITWGDKSLRFNNGKSLIGTLAGVTVCMLITAMVFAPMHLSSSQIVLVSFAGGLAGGLAEMLPFKVDDNVSIPIVSGAVVTFISLMMGIGF